MLQVQLAKLEQSLAAKLDMGGSLQQVDYEQLKIQHAQAQATLDKHSAQAVGLKLDVGAAVQVGGQLNMLGGVEGVGGGAGQEESWKVRSSEIHHDAAGQGKKLGLGVRAREEHC